MDLIKNFLSFRFWSLFFILLWLNLTHFNFNQFVLAIIFSIISCKMLSILEIKPLKMKRIYLWVIIIINVIYDTLIGHICLLKTIIWPNVVQDGFIIVDINLKDPQVIALLSCVTALSPSAIWISYDKQKQQILFHLLDIRSEEGFRQKFHTIYEKNFKDIFEVDHDKPII